jgi:hypothetical protein
MIKVFKKEGYENDDIRIINTETGDFEHYFVDKNIGFPFSFYKTNISDMGYDSVKTCIKTLKERNFLGKEINYNEQKESEKIGYINLGVCRLNRLGSIEDICNKLEQYGLSFIDVQNCIIETYLNNKKVVTC